MSVELCPLWNVNMIEWASKRRESRRAGEWIERGVMAYCDGTRASSVPEPKPEPEPVHNRDWRGRLPAHRLLILLILLSSISFRPPPSPPLPFPSFFFSSALHDSHTSLALFPAHQRSLPIPFFSRSRGTHHCSQQAITCSSARSSHTVPAISPCACCLSSRHCQHNPVLCFPLLKSPL